MYFIREAVKRKIGVYIRALCMIGAVAVLVKMYPMAWTGKCIVGFEGFCRVQACSVSEDWHIARQLPWNGLRRGVLPFYGPWRAAYRLLKRLSGVICMIEGFNLGR